MALDTPSLTNLSHPRNQAMFLCGLAFLRGSHIRQEYDVFRRVVQFWVEWGPHRYMFDITDHTLASDVSEIRECLEKHGRIFGAALTARAHRAWASIHMPDAVFPQEFQ